MTWCSAPNSTFDEPVRDDDAVRYGAGCAAVDDAPAGAMT